MYMKRRSFEKSRAFLFSLYREATQKWEVQKPQVSGRVWNGVPNVPILSVILRANLEIALRMLTYGAYLGSLLAHHDMSAVAALPYGVALA